MWLIFALLAALAAAIAVTLSKAGIKNLDPSLGFAIQSVCIIVVAWSVVAFQKSAGAIASIDRKTWIFLVAAGVITCISSLLTFRALKLGDASVVSPIERVSLVFAIILAAIFLKEKLTWQIIVGAMLMFSGAVLIALSKKGS
ncbi:EamA family transporter [Segetibacter sp. 3557_3]|uniref:EamA family transporter n=1 Tax=Segetibacter sp. 3557_3 TaxID=2547429 RepID=UPI001058EF0F|nr:EamA family transporter [Segetibacter sp. 3557_3]TDH27907.1 EamA family transporter [Segetibacter sp. 3557_3]